MSTCSTSVPIQITCPDWCEVSPEEHAANLWDLGGTCDHRSECLSVEDTEGYTEPMEKPQMWDAFQLQLAALTTPDGRPQATPILFLDGRGVSPTQALALADALRAMVQLSRGETQA